MSAIFLCYRRDDAAGYVHAIRDRLAARLDPEQIFMDIDSIEPGFDFVEVIERSVASCSVLLALIGKRWSPERLQDSRDFVRLEIMTAIEKKIRVIPVLLDGAEMPKPEALPAELAPLSRRHAYEVSSRRFNDDAEGLADQVEKILREQKPKKSPPPKPKSPPQKPKKSPPPKPLVLKAAPPAKTPVWPTKSPPPPPAKPRVRNAGPLDEGPPDLQKKLGWSGGLIYGLGFLATIFCFYATLYVALHVDSRRIDENMYWLLYPSDALLLLGWGLNYRRSPKAWICFLILGAGQILALGVMETLEFGPRLWFFGSALVFILLSSQIWKLHDPAED